ncbi:TerB family tellurite resistance protein [Solitalea lacus]|uniref:TerB family tellurite resistance protein n=1 Tax=Solitalea lacus TaxID=2911172 RepID=UPI001EDB3C93|nr:TerB family tellurite resistance protein [Solitalea lacus]UKJ06693.1 TerB family tellurite resistance protein [Solitalea lacus]
MFNDELYAELGKLFYLVASADRKVHMAEKESLIQLIQNTWIPLENSIDRHGTDKANIIDFSFEYEEAEGFPENEFESFESFYHANKERFTKEIITNILKTCHVIASAYHATNKKEQEVINKIAKLFEN